MPLPKPKKGAPRQVGKLPPPEASGDFDPFLNASHIGRGKLGDSAVLTFLGKCSLDENNEFGARLQCDVLLKGEKYVFGVKLDGGSYGRLYRRFGDNPKKWKGKVNVEVKKHMGKLYVAVV